MIPRTFHVRRGFVHLALLAVFFGLAVRVSAIQCLRHGRWSRLAGRMERDVVRTEAPRGDILDRSGLGLAVTAPGVSVYANPRAVPAARRGAVARELASVLQVDAGRVAARLSLRKYFVWIKRNISPEEAEAVEGLALPGVGFREHFLRRYPNGRFLCHVLGYVGVDNEGLGGLEARYEEVLRGRPGERQVLRDGLRRAVGKAGGTLRPAVSGRSLVLTIDSRVQRIVEEELAAAFGEHRPCTACAVVMDPRNGEVLALAVLPGFDPARYGAVPGSLRRNMAAGECVEPGSTFKPFIAAAALEYGVVTPETVFNCRKGRYRLGRRVLHDAHPFGCLSVRDIIVHSSNIGMAQVATRLGAERMHAALRGFGFGRRSGIGLPGESAGILRHRRQWSRLSVASIAMGQEVAVTPLQLTAGFCVFANGGWYVSPRIVMGYAGRGVRGIVERPAPRRVLSERVARLMCCDLLRGVVDRGTARRSAIAGYAMAGKTGTAQIARREGGGYEPGAYIAAFVGIVPVEAPRFVITVVMKRPSGGSHYGGVVSAPAAARMAERILSGRRVPRSREG